MTGLAVRPQARPLGRAARRRTPSLSVGVVTLWLSLMVALPLAAVGSRAFEDGWGAFWRSATAPQALSALWFTLGVSLAVTGVNAVFGLLVAWVLERDRFPGKRALNAVIDLPFALPTVVTGLTLLALYGDAIAYTKWAVVMALLFVTLPFCVRAVQPVLRELDREAEEAAASLGASGPVIFRRVILPHLVPALVSGCALAFARAVGEFGSVVLISGNIPFDTQVSAVYAFKQIESDNIRGASAVSVTLLAAALAVLFALRLFERLRDHRGEA